MKFLWDADLKLNVVHVDDVVAAIWAAAVELKPHTVYNLSDAADLGGFIALYDLLLLCSLMLPARHWIVSCRPGQA